MRLRLTASGLKSLYGGNGTNFLDYGRFFDPAWLKDRHIARRAGEYLRAWFVTPETRMNPNLEYSQGVHGQSTDRNYGIIDTLHLVEMARQLVFSAPNLSLQPIYRASSGGFAIIWCECDT